MNNNTTISYTSSMSEEPFQYRYLEYNTLSVLRFSKFRSRHI
jgi:hypothetical protein